MRCVALRGCARGALHGCAAAKSCTAARLQRAAPHKALIRAPGAARGILCTAARGLGPGARSPRQETAGRRPVPDLGPKSAHCASPKITLGRRHHGLSASHPTASPRLLPKKNEECPALLKPAPWQRRERRESRRPVLVLGLDEAQAALLAFVDDVDGAPVLVAAASTSKGGRREAPREADDAAPASRRSMRDATATASGRARARSRRRRPSRPPTPSTRSDD